MRLFTTSLALVAGLALVLGLFGAYHPFFDGIAIGRRVAIYAVLILTGLSLLMHGRRGLGIVCFFAAIGVFASFHLSNAEKGSVRIYTKNLWYANAEVTAVAADIRLTKPDVIFLQEVSDTNRSLLSSLKDVYPHQALCPWQGWNGGAVLSRWPLATAAPRCSPERTLIAVNVARPEGAFWAVGVHLQQPWPDVQWAHLEQGMSVISNLDGGAIVAGDFNTVPWAAAAGKIGQFTHTRPVQPQQITFHLWGVGLPLDQVWADGGRAELRPLLGSDHHGVVADVWPSDFAK